MNKPFSLIVSETEQKVVEIINNSQLPAYVLKNILQGIYAEIERVDNEEIAKYNEAQEKSQKKESDK
jgi:hypothetical protein